MRFLVVLRRRTESFSDEQFAPMLDEEAARVRALYAEGIVRAAHGRGDMAGAVLELETPDVESAQRAIDSLPLYAAKMLEGTIIPLKPYRGFV